MTSCQASSCTLLVFTLQPRSLTSHPHVWQFIFPVRDDTLDFRSGSRRMKYAVGQLLSPMGITLRRLLASSFGQFVYMPGEAVLCTSVSVHHWHSAADPTEHSCGCSFSSREWHVRRDTVFSGGTLTHVSAADSACHGVDSAFPRRASSMLTRALVRNAFSWLVQLLASGSTAITNSTSSPSGRCCAL